MLQSELIRKQEELDLKKYNQSFLAHCDLAGKMEYCKGCMFRTEMPACDMDHETRQKFTVCARNAVRLEEVNHVVKKTKFNCRPSGGQLVLDSNSGQTKRNKKKSPVL